MGKLWFVVVSLGTIFNMLIVEYLAILWWGNSLFVDCTYLLDRISCQANIVSTAARVYVYVNEVLGKVRFHLQYLPLSEIEFLSFQQSGACSVIKATALYDSCILCSKE